MVSKLQEYKKIVQHYLLESLNILSELLLEVINPLYQRLDEAKLNIRAKTSLLFVVFVGSLMLVSFIFVYLLDNRFREEAFFERLNSRVEAASQVYLASDDIDPLLLREFYQRFSRTLPYEIITIYNGNDERVLIYSEAYNPTSPDSLRLIRERETIKFKRGDRQFFAEARQRGSETFVVIASAINEAGKQEARSLYWVLFITFWISLATSGALSWHFSGRVLMPLTRFISRLNEISARDLSERVDDQGTNDEIGILADTFNQLLDRIQSAFNLQKSFIANASHELRTPIAALIGDIEVTLMKARSESEYVRALENALDASKSLRRLSQLLLETAQVSGESAQTLLQPFRLDEVIIQAVSEMNSVYAQHSLEVEFLPEEIDEAPEAMGNEDLIKAAVTNLLDNALKYSPATSAVKVTLDLRQVGKARIMVQDKGYGISETDMKHIFEPFFRADSIRSITGYGLGLPLVKQICKMHDGSLHLISKEGEGTTAIIELPLAVD